MSRRDSAEPDAAAPSVGGALAPAVPCKELAARLKLVHAFGVYPLAIRDAVISVGDDAFLFCAGRHIAVCDQVRHRLAFLPRAAENRVITAAARAGNGKFLAVAERLGSGAGAEGGLEPGLVQISIFALPRAETILEALLSKAEAREAAQPLRVLKPKNHKIDIVGLAWTPDTKHLVSLSAMPDSTVTYWRWEADKAVSSHDVQVPLTRLHVNPGSNHQISLSGKSYMRLWEYNPNDHQLREHPSVFPLKQERSANVVDHCWLRPAGASAQSCFLCAATEDGHVHLFQDAHGHGRHEDIDVRAQISRDEAGGPKAVEREQAKQLQALMGMSLPGGASADEPPPVRLTALAPWGRGFVVGGDQGFVGIFKVDTKMQPEPFGSFRMPGEEDVIWQMSAGSEDSNLTIISCKQEKGGRGSGADAPLGAAAPVKKVVAEGLDLLLGRWWSLTSFPVGQADLAATGQLEVFKPVFPLGTHRGGVSAMSVCKLRRVFATCSSDMHLKVWSYPDEEGQNSPNAFTAEVSIHVSAYEKPVALALHPLGFQVAVVLENLLRVYHVTNQEVTRTLFDLPLRHPGDVCYSNGGGMLAVTTEHDIVLLDPWRLSLIHMFSGRGGHLSAVNQVLFSEDDRLLLSCGAAPHGAIYGFDLESQGKERVLEHVSKNTSYSRIAHDFRRRLVVACVRPEGFLRVIDNEGAVVLELQPERPQAGSYTTMCLAPALGLLLAGTQAGSVALFRWPPELRPGSAPPLPLAEVPLHAHAICAMSLSGNARLLFTACEGGAIMASETGLGVPQETGVAAMGSKQLESALMRYRYREDGPPARKVQREEERKLSELQKKLGVASHGVSASCCPLEELVLVPRNWLNEQLQEIKELEDRMQGQKRESDYLLEQKEADFQEQLNAGQQERRHERGMAESKFDELFRRFKQSNERHQEAMSSANRNFDTRVREAQEENERKLSKEYEKQSRLLSELQGLREQHEGQLRQVEAKHEAQLAELRGAQERALREWRGEYEKVCNLLKSDGLKFEKALQQQEDEYESQIFEIQEHKRVALQVESEKSTTALKDTMSMKQTIHMLQGQLKSRREELGETLKERDDLLKKLEESREMFAKVNDQLKEQKRSLAAKDENLKKVREQMKHLESFRFVLYHRLNALEEERDPLEEQVSSLKTSVREMYGEFVREFRQKQKLDQQLGENTALSSALQKEALELRAKLSQMKKDGRRLLQDVEGVLHPESSSDFAAMPKRLQQVLEKHSKMAQWTLPAPPEAAPAAPMAVDGEVAEGAGLSKEEMLISEMTVQRDLLFRKNQIAVASANQTKKECGEDFRRLMTENAALITEMNSLRDEKRSYQRSCQELEAELLGLKRKAAESLALGRSGSAPDLAASPGSGRRGAKGREATKATPFVRRKVVDQQELQQRKLRSGSTRGLPPLGAKDRRVMSVEMPFVSGSLASLSPKEGSSEELPALEEMRVQLAAPVTEEESDGGA